MFATFKASLFFKMVQLPEYQSGKRKAESGLFSQLYAFRFPLWPGKDYFYFGKLRCRVETSAMQCWRLKAIALLLRNAMRLSLSVCSLGLWLLVGTSLALAQSLSDTQQLAQKGRYAEALQAVQSLEGAPARQLQYDVELIIGKTKAAAASLRLLQELEPNSIQTVRREIAQLLARCEWNQASQAIQAAEQHTNDPVLRWQNYECQLHLPQWKLGKDSLAWFTQQDVSQWNEDVPALLAFANEVLGAAGRRHPHDARIPALRAEFFAAKHNAPAALEAMQVSLAANASSVEAHALRAELALAQFDLATAQRAREQMQAICGHNEQVVLLEAAAAFAELSPERAMLLLEAVHAEQPQHPEVIGGLLAAYTVTSGSLTEEQQQNFQRLQQSIAEQGRGAIPILLAQGNAYELMRHIRLAETVYRSTFELAPEFPGVRALWVQQLLRLNENDRVPELLPAAFREDPFDVRLKNTMAVWDVLQNYASLETEHFVVRFDRAHDELLAKYMSRYLEEEVYPALIKRFGYAPANKSVFEIYNRARNTSGHGWFSARMVGLPGLHTVGACSGNLVAIASPTDMPRPYHWARVVRHEFVHRLNMEQTNYFVPHWITEGMAVDAEERPMPDEWQRLITQRAKEGKLFTLETINFGFIRPSTSQDRTLAYAQAEWYVRYLREQYGEAALPQLLQNIAHQQSPQQSLEKLTGKSTAEFERGYREFLNAQIERWNLSSVVTSSDAESLRKSLATDPNNSRLQAELAATLLSQGEIVQAKHYAQTALKMAAHEQTATWVLAQLALRDQDRKTAEQLSVAGLNLARPHADLLHLLLELKMANQQFDIAEKLALLGRKHYPTLALWDAPLQKIYTATHNSEQLRVVLERQVQCLEDDPSIALQLAKITFAERDWPATEHWATAALRIDVKSSAAHAWLAQALHHQKKYSAALAEFSVAGAKALGAAGNLSYAQSLLATDNKTQARTIVEELIRTAPDLPGLVELARQVEP
jgi:cellulose synthase operon protein C